MIHLTHLGQRILEPKRDNETLPTNLCVVDMRCSIIIKLLYLIIHLPIKLVSSVQVYKRLIRLSCGMVILGKCHLDEGHTWVKISLQI